MIVKEKACPICKGDVKGNDQALYFCKQCNILFANHSLIKDYHPKEKEESPEEEGIL